MTNNLLDSNKKLLHLIVFLFSIFFSLFMLYLYYGFFQHDRYFETIRKVEDTEIAIIKGFAKIEKVGSSVEKNIDSYKEIFDGLNNKLPVRILLEGEEIYSNILSAEEIKTRNDLRYHWEGLRKKPIKITLGNSKYLVEIDRYIPPKWRSEFYRWLRQPSRWFSPLFDVLTVPFLIFMVLFYSFFFAWLWAYRSRHLSKEMQDVLDEVIKSR